MRLVDPTNGKTTFLHEFSDNEGAFSLCLMELEGRGDELFLVVGCVKDLVHAPRRHAGGRIHLFRFTNNNTALELVHTVRWPRPPTAGADS